VNSDKYTNVRYILLWRNLYNSRHRLSVHVVVIIIFVVIVAIFGVMCMKKNGPGKIYFFIIITLFFSLSLSLFNLCWKKKCIHIRTVAARRKNSTLCIFIASTINALTLTLLPFSKKAYPIYNITRCYAS
jgi:hypothetical protein